MEFEFNFSLWKLRLILFDLWIMSVVFLVDLPFFLQWHTLSLFYNHKLNHRPIPAMWMSLWDHHHSQHSIGVLETFWYTVSQSHLNQRLSFSLLKVIHTCTYICKNNIHKAICVYFLIFIVLWIIVFLMIQIFF